MAKWDFAKLSASKMQTKDYEIDDIFSNISITADTAEIDFVLTEDEKCKVVCYENVKETHEVKVENGTLFISLKNEKAWYDYIGFNFSSPKISVYLPEFKYDSLKINSDTSDVKIAKGFKIDSIDIEVSTGNVECYAWAEEAAKIKTSTGNISIENIAVGSLDLTVSTGKITATDIDCNGDFNITVSTGNAVLTDIRCQNLTTSGDTGKVVLKNLIATRKISIVRTTGDVRLEGSDAGEILIETSTGKVSGSLLSSKVFIVKTSTGDIDVPETTEGGVCKITTSTGNIEITID